MFLSNLRRISERTWLVTIIVGYLGLAAAYSVINPAFESPDEIHHYAYVDYLLRERHLPVAELGGPESEYHQPPLYYLLGALVAAPVQEAQSPYAAIERNPFWGWRIGQVGVDNKNQFVHGQAEAWPYRDWVLRLHLVRWLSVALQVVTLLATYGIGREIFPKRPEICLGALAFVAFVPQFIFVSGSASNDNLIVPLTALVIWLLVRSLRLGLHRGRVFALGVLSGLAVVTKMSGLALLPLSGAVVLLIIGRSRSWKQIPWAGALLTGPAALLAGPVLVRNQVLYGEPTALARMSAIWGQHDPPLSYAKALREVPNVWTSFWARFGYGQIPIPDALYWLLLAVTGLAFVGLVIGLLRAWGCFPPVAVWSLALLAAVGVLYAFLVLSYVRVSLTGGNGRFAFPALPAYALLLFLGLSAWLPRRWHVGLAWIAHGGMLTFAMVALLAFLRPAYAAPPLLSVPPTPSHFIGWRLGDLAILHGYALDRDIVHAGEDVTITLFWEAQTASDVNYVAFVHLLAPADAQVGARDTYPGLGRYPTTQWRPGDIFADPVSVPLLGDKAVSGPVALRIEVGLYDLGTGERLPVTDAEGRSVELPVIGRVKLAPLTWPQVQPPVADRREFGEEIALLGYDLTPVAEPGQTLAFTLYWQALQHPKRDYNVFIHLVGAADTIVAQGDGPPLAGAYPTSLWAESEALTDPRTMALPADLAPGAYQLRIGLYDPVSGQRLPVSDAAGRMLGDAITLPALHVSEVHQ